MFRAKSQRGKDAKKKVTVRIIENYQNLIIQLQLNILLILNSFPDSGWEWEFEALPQIQ